MISFLIELWETKLPNFATLFSLDIFATKHISQWSWQGSTTLNSITTTAYQNKSIQHKILPYIINFFSITYIKLFSFSLIHKHCEDSHKHPILPIMIHIFFHLSLNLTCFNKLMTWVEKLAPTPTHLRTSQNQ